MKQHPQCDVLAIETYPGDFHSDIPVIADGGVDVYEVAVDSTQAAQRCGNELSDGPNRQPGIGKCVEVGRLG
jgi:hypothetical protein